MTKLANTSYFDADDGFESFENISNTSNSPNWAGGYFNVGSGTGAYTFGSSLNLTSKIGQSGEILVGDFKVGSASYGLANNGVIDASDIPDGSAYLANNHTKAALTFNFAEGTRAAGAYVAGVSNVTISAYGLNGELIEQITAPAGTDVNWKNNFLGISADRDIYKIVFSGDYIVLDGFRFERSNDPVVLNHSLSPVLTACDLGATLGTDDLKTTADVDSSHVTYTITQTSAGTLLIDGEIASTGSTFTQADIDAGHVQLLAGPILPLTSVATPNGAISGAGIAFADTFHFTASDGQGGKVDGVFTAGHTAFDTVQTSAQYGGYWGGNGNDYQLGTANADNMSGGNGCDLMIGGGGNDQMHGGEGNNHIFGQVGNDNLTGGSGDDLLDGGTGDDQLHANGGNNILIGGAGSDMMTAGDGNDRMFGDGGDDTMQANGGNNRIDGGAGNDVINVGSGNDVVIGGTGTDRISDNGGSNKFQLGGIKGAVSDGNDSYTTGSGADKYALLLNDRDGNAAGWGKDVVNGFRIAEGDQLVAFSSKAGFWDDRANLGNLIDQGFVSGSRSSDGGDLTLKFGTGEAASSVTLKWFFWDNASFLSDAEKASSFGQNITKANLIGILEDAIQDGGSVGVSGSDFVNAAHNYVSHDFML